MNKIISLQEFLDKAIISSRVRVARNLVVKPFPVALTKKKGEALKGGIARSLMENTEIGVFNYIDLNKVAYNDAKVIVEKNLAGSTILQNRDIKSILISKDECTSVLINDEDHIRIQNLKRGFDLLGSWKIISNIDDQIDQTLDYAFDEKLGYLTSCTTNVGTGLRASVLVHLPGLTLTGYMDRIYQAANQIGMAVRGTFGEGTDIYGSLYQISNQITLGRTETEIIGTLMEVTKEIVRKEKDACETILGNHRLNIEDKVFRALGILQHARLLDLQEAVELISDVRLGMYLGLLDKDVLEIEKILIKIQDGNLQEKAGKLVTNIEKLRADFLREIW